MSTLGDQLTPLRLAVRAYLGRDLESVEALTPDASLRRYFRLSFPDRSSIIGCIFDSLAVPEATGGSSLNSFEATLALAHFFNAHGIPVPALYYSQESPPVLLLEDLGTAMLSLHLEGGSFALERHYKRAIDIIVQIQGIKPPAPFFAYERSFTRDVYLREMSELIDFVLLPAGAKDTERAVVQECFRSIAAELQDLPRALAHRDFHSWNLMIDHAENVRVLDFQDALMAPRPYDLVGLLNDRDTDTHLGTALYRQLLRYFQSEMSYGESFWREYDCVLLQRDLKVAGRFAKLVRTRALHIYGTWIPGTLRRLGRTLVRMSREREGVYGQALEVLCDRLPDLRRGAETPLELRDDSTLAPGSSSR
jgi:N-acetylmuramate 1-kinase